MYECEKLRERRRLEQEGYCILTDSDMEDLYDFPTVKQSNPAPKPSRVRLMSCYGGPVLDQTGKPFPSRWPHWCRHCCHPFETAPIGVPVKHDDSRNLFYCIDPCCSDRCAWARIVERGWALGMIGQQFITMMRKAYKLGWKYRPCPAPPQTRLQQFGGDLTIQEFRTHGDRFICWKVPNNIIMESEQLAELERVEQRDVRSHREKIIDSVKSKPVEYKPRVGRKRKTATTPLTTVRPTPLPSAAQTLDRFLRR